MMRSALALVIVLCAACAPPNAGSGIATTSDVPITGSPVRIRSGAGPMVSVVPFPLERVWATLPAVYDSLGIPIDQLDRAQHVIGNSGFKVHKRLGNVALSKFIDCGNTQGFPSADEYDVTISVLTQVEVDKSGATSIATRVEAAGRPIAFPGAYTKCPTRGLLESRIADAVNLKLQG